jgi:hypothetical protein
VDSIALEKVEVGEKGSRLIFDGLHMVVSESARTSRCIFSTPESSYSRLQ